MCKPDRNEPIAVSVSGGLILWQLLASCTFWSKRDVKLGIKRVLVKPVAATTVKQKGKKP